MKKYLISIFIALFVFSAAVSAQSRSSVRKTDFMNYSYKSSICTENFEVPNSVRVAGGKFAEGEAYFTIQGKAVYGDLNGDRSEDAVVHAKCGSTAGNFTDSQVFVYGIKAGKTTLLASIDTDEMERNFKRYFRGGFIVSVKNVKIENARIVVQAYTDGSNAGPKHLSTLIYRLIGGKLSLTGRPVRRPSGIG